MSSWADLLARSDPGAHLVQLYGEDDQSLARNVSQYLAEGLRRGDGVVLISTPEHTSAIARHLVEMAPDMTSEAVRTGRLTCLSARETLERLLVDGRPDETRFRSVVGKFLDGVRRRSATGTVRAFGEMVNLLWQEGRSDDAHRLEELWNLMTSEYACSMYCAYRIDLVEDRSDAAALHAIIGSHDHLLAGAGTLLSSGRSRG